MEVGKGPNDDSRYVESIDWVDDGPKENDFVGAKSDHFWRTLNNGHSMITSTRCQRVTIQRRPTRVLTSVGLRREPLNQSGSALGSSVDQSILDIFHHLSRNLCELQRGPKVESWPQNCPKNGQKESNPETVSNIVLHLFQLILWSDPCFCWCDLTTSLEENIFRKLAL